MSQSTKTRPLRLQNTHIKPQRAQQTHKTHHTRREPRIPHHHPHATMDATHTTPMRIRRALTTRLQLHHRRHLQHIPLLRIRHTATTTRPQHHPTRRVRPTQRTHRPRPTTHLPTHQLPRAHSYIYNVRERCRALTHTPQLHTRRTPKRPHHHHRPSPAHRTTRRHPTHRTTQCPPTRGNTHHTPTRGNLSPLRRLPHPTSRKLHPSRRRHAHPTRHTPHTPRTRALGQPQGNHRRHPHLRHRTLRNSPQPTKNQPTRLHRQRFLDFFYPQPHFLRKTFPLFQNFSVLLRPQNLKTSQPKNLKT